MRENNDTSNRNVVNIFGSVYCASYTFDGQPENFNKKQNWALQGMIFGNGEEKREVSTPLLSRISYGDWENRNRQTLRGSICIISRNKTLIVTKICGAYSL